MIDASRTLKEAWIISMQSILTSKLTTKVEDYMELINYSISFGFDDIYCLKSDERIYNDFMQMEKVFFSDEKNEFGHNYANTILNPISSITDPITSISMILKKNSTTRKAVLTFAPYGDEKIPCITSIQFLVRNNKLFLIYNSRGQDIYRKFPCDAMCIAKYGEQVAAINGYDLGNITANISSAHIYIKDIEKAKDYIKKQFYNRQIIVTSNKNKYLNYKTLLDKNNVELQVHSLDFPEIQSLNMIDVVKAKAKYAFEILGYPVWVDDTGLVLEDYPFFPGSFTKFMIKQIGIDGLSKLLNNQSKKGKMICYLCKYDGFTYDIVKGKNEGYLDLNRSITDEKMPLNSLFIGQEKMFHRTDALNKLFEFIDRKY